jgi:hypothetical protein
LLASEAEQAAAQDEYITRLAVVVLRDGIAEEGMDFITSDDAVLWLGVLGLDKGAVVRAGGGATNQELADSLLDAMFGEHVG